MAASTHQKGGIAIAASAVQLFPDSITGKWRVWIRNNLAVNEMYVGGADVTEPATAATEGKVVAAATDMAAQGFECLNPNGLFAVCAGAETTDAQVLAVRVE